MNEPKSYRAIMLSSTFTDLRQHRDEVIETIHKFGFMANVMEYDGARADADVIESSMQMVRDSVAYIGVISRKYGQTPFDADRNPERLSITELEFNEAVRLRRPIILFMMDANHPLIEADVELDSGKRKKLDAFRARAVLPHKESEATRVFETFDSLKQFSKAASIAIGRLIHQLIKHEPPTASVTGTEPPVQRRALSNIPFSIPLHFLGRDHDLAAIDSALKQGEGRAAVTALHGMRGVGKTILAAAYAELHRDEYRATWWIRAETESTIRVDLVGLGVQLGWVARDATEELALAVVLEQLRRDGHGILMIYDNAIGPDEVGKFLPRGAGFRAIVTSNAPNFHGVASPFRIETWSHDIGADFLIARTGRMAERSAGIALSQALGGLPLAHEQAAAYCDRIGISLGEYFKRFPRTSGNLIDDVANVPREYGLTVTRTFVLAIEEAGKRHPAAEALITYAALLAPEPIPLFLFSEGRDHFSEPLHSSLIGEGLDDAVGVLRTFALVDRESISDERDATATTDCIRLHRLVRAVAVARIKVASQTEIRRELINATAHTYPKDVHRNPAVWPRARRLDAIAMALVAGTDELPKGSEIAAANLLDGLDSYRDGALAAYSDAQKLALLALAIRERALGPNHPDTATSLNNLGYLRQAQGDYVAARPCYERALAIREKTLRPDHPDIATSLNNLSYLLQEQGDYASARPYCERALAIREKELGPIHPDTARSLNNVGFLRQELGDYAGARAFYDRALSIREAVLEPDHPDTAGSLTNLGRLLQTEGNYSGARAYHERALAIREKKLGPEHPRTATSLNHLAGLLDEQGDYANARVCSERALTILENALGVAHPHSKRVARKTVSVLEKLNGQSEAEAIRKKFDI